MKQTDLTTYDRTADDLLTKIAEGGRAHPHEARNMARELLQLRKGYKNMTPDISLPFPFWGMVP